MKPIRMFFGRHSDIALVTLVLGVLIVLFAPIPSGLLDFLILSNFSFAFLILLLTFYYAKRMHDEIEFADYLQLSSLGLIEALDRFDPQVGVLFKTFAARRMHGAILDGLERLTEKQQQIAARQRLEAQRRAAIRDAADRQDKPGTRQRSPDQLLQFVAEAGLAFALAWILDGTGMVQTSEKSETLPFYRSVELGQLRERIIEMVRALPPQEKRVIQSHYFQEIAFEEIAGTMGLTRGRISQIHKQGLLRLKELLRNHFECDVSL